MRHGLGIDMNYSGFQQFADYWNETVGHNATSTTHRHTATAAVATTLYLSTCMTATVATMTISGPLQLALWEWPIVRGGLDCHGLWLQGTTY